MCKNSIDNLGKSVDIHAITFDAFQYALKAMQGKTDSVLKDNCVIVLTNFGQIFCKLDEKESIGEIIAKAVLQARNSALENIEPETPTINECKTLILKNVVIIPFANPQVKINYNVITLFTDQIVGLSIGSLPSEFA